MQKIESVTKFERQNHAEPNTEQGKNLEDPKKKERYNHVDPKKVNAAPKNREPKIPVPTNYRNASKYVRLAVVEKRNIQPLIEQDKHFRLGRTLVGRALSNMPIIDAIYKQLDLATVEPRLNEWLAKVLISELLFGSGKLLGNSLPVECVKRYETQLRTLLKDIEAKQSAAGLVKEPRFVRLNTNQLNLEGAKRLLAEEEWMLVEENFTDYRSFLERVKRLDDSEYMVDFHFPDMLVFPHSAKSFWARAQHLQDRFLLQNKACLLPTYLLKPPKKSVVLDMCSAPGLKATHLACLMKNKGRIYAVEQDANRYSVLCEYAGPFGMIRTIHSDCLEVTDEQVPGVEYVLLDPSCSGSGMLQRQLVPEPIDEKRLYRLAGLQYKLLSHAMNAFPNVRRIVYSTCSVHAEENEGVVQGVLRHNGHYRLLDARKELGKEWLNVGSSEYPGIGELCLYAKTVDDLTIGMFVAVFERCPEGVENEVYLAHEKQKLSYELVAKKLSRQGKEKHCTMEGVNQQEDFVTAVEQSVKDELTSKQHTKKCPKNNTVEEQNDLEEVHEKASSKKRKIKSTEEDTIEGQNDQEEAKEKLSSKKRKDKSIQENTTEEQNGQEEVKEKASSKKRKDKSTEEQNDQEEAKEKASSKKRKDKSIQENTIEEQNGQEEVKEKASSKKRKDKSIQESTSEEQNGQEEVKEKASSKKRKHKSTEENTTEKQNDQEEAKEKVSSKKRKDKSIQENTTEEQNGQEEVKGKASSKKRKDKSIQENTTEEQNGQEEVKEKASSKKRKHKSTEENTTEKQNDQEEAKEKVSSKKRKDKSIQENTTEEQNGQEEMKEKVSSKKRKDKSIQENTTEEQNGQEEVKEKASSRKRKNNL
ncbi:uncharacterized protein LOC128306380 [Anopheles moucheti]|uniref:uncharacterized protein LOC128306380 n=1 Tax=Anopheles moucheti TaxID=186751 RepID=UPI0022EFF718|nr:uncharacterized protein LOC128306380 [Anopheles moucheti]